MTKPEASPRKTPSESAADRIARALDYPYPAPGESYLFQDGTMRPMTAPASILDRNRFPVLAFGSNRSPVQLARKYADWPSGTAIPVTSALLQGWDVVYGSHITGYGSLPAALIPSPQTGIRIAVTWLTGDQLRRMHETESSDNYAFSELKDVSIEILDLDVIGLDRPATVYYYRPIHGPLALDREQPVALAGIAATGRQWSSMDQRGVQAAIRDRLAPGQSLDSFVLGSINDAELRRRRTRALRDSLSL